jgi:SAM-dependent methyltransferase
MADADSEKFFAALDESLARGSFVKLTLAKYRGPEADLKNVYVRAVTLKGGERLSFLYRYRTRDAVKNHTFAAGVRLVREMLGADFASGHLFTTTEDLQLEFNRRGEPRLVIRPPAFAAAPAHAHDRRKRRAIETAGSVYLQALGVTNERGEVRPAMGDKLRQINKFVEIVEGLHAASTLAGREEFSVVDMGAGKGYLTFAVYDYFNNALDVRADVTGVEARTELVALCNDIARRAGFDRLRFQPGFIQDFELPRTDMLIALHACDTATDDAIYKGIAAEASVIVTAPCCHKEVRPQIRPPRDLRGVLRHGHLLEREAESVTDSLRALLLEHAGYRVKVFEFISTEHTRKNTMIAAVRQDATTDREATDRETALREYRALKEFYGIREQRLEQLLCGV